MNPKLPLVEVIWHDAWVRAEETISLDEVRHTHKPVVVRTLGWLLQEDDIGVSLANEHLEDAYRGRTFIYRPMIISVTPFSLTKVRNKRVPAKKSSPPLPPVPSNAGLPADDGSSSASS